MTASSLTYGEMARMMREAVKDSATGTKATLRTRCASMATTSSVRGGSFPPNEDTEMALQGRKVETAGIEPASAVA